MRFRSGQNDSPETVTTMRLSVLALNLEEGGEMLRPMAVAAIGGLGTEMLAALCMYVFTSKHMLLP